MAVVVCDGHRCRALSGRTGVEAGETLLGVMGSAIRGTRHGVLIRSECLGVCHRAPAVVLGRRGDSAGRLYGPVEDPNQVQALLGAIQANDAGRPAVP